MPGAGLLGSIAARVGSLAGDSTPLIARAAGFVGRHQLAAQTIGGAGAGYFLSGGEVSGALVGAGFGAVGAKLGYNRGKAWQAGEVGKARAALGEAQLYYRDAKRGVRSVQRSMRGEVTSATRNLGGDIMGVTQRRGGRRVRRSVATGMSPLMTEMKNTRSTARASLSTARQSYASIASGSSEFIQRGIMRRRLGGALAGGAIGGLGVLAVSSVGSSFGNRGGRSPYGTTFSGMGNGTVLGY